MDLVQRYPGRLGWLLSPASFKTPRSYVPFALDNDAYTHWRNGTEFDYPKWLKFLDKMRDQPIQPLWCAVPDLVADKRGTIDRWRRYAPVAACYGWPLCFVVQDGMMPRDVPKDAPVIFVGGTTEWKWRTIPMWADHFPRVHVGRCGTSRWRLERLEQLGIESCDSSGFFRATFGGRESRHLRAWLDPIGTQPNFAFA